METGQLRSEDLMLLGNPIVVTRIIPNLTPSQDRNDLLGCKIKYAHGCKGNIDDAGGMRKKKLDKDTIKTLEKLKSMDRYLPKGESCSWNRAIQLPPIGRKVVQNSILEAKDNSSEKEKLIMATKRKESVIKLPPILEQMVKRQSLQQRAKDQAMTYTLWRTPPLQSVYFRWKKSPRCEKFCQVENVITLFKEYGSIERVVYCSLNSAIVVFNHIRSACAASTNVTRKCSMNELFVIWLPEYLQVPMQSHFKTGSNVK